MEIVFFNGGCGSEKLPLMAKNMVKKLPIEASLDLMRRMIKLGLTPYYNHSATSAD